MKKITNKQKALIHIAKAETGMSENEYRDLLGSVGVESSRDLTHGKFDELMRHFKGLGFKARKPVAKRRRGKAHMRVSSKKRLLSKIDAILADLGLKRGYADSIARNMFQIDLAGWCDAQQLHKIVAALTYHQKRRSAA